MCLWHGWLLEGSGSNVYAARVTEAWRRDGHDVVLVCQEPHPERFAFIDAWGTVGGEVSELQPTGAPAATGRVVLLRPQIGSLLPVFVWDEYEGFEVKTFVDLTDEELEEYLTRNVTALRAAIEWHNPDAVITGHAIPGGAIGLGAAGAGKYVAKLHGSDIEYAVRVQPRYKKLARVGLEGARVVVGASADVVRRTVELIPSIAEKTAVISPGVDVARFRPRPRREALELTASLLDADPDTRQGRPLAMWADVGEALDARDAERLDALAGRYDQNVPDPDAATLLRQVAIHRGPIVGYIGKLIPQKGVELLIQALAIENPDVWGLVIGFGTFREWLAALCVALGRGDVDAVRWLGESSDMQIELAPVEISAAGGLTERGVFTGRLDHRYAPSALAAMDVLVVPSTLAEAFAMVTAEGAAAGALPLAARHSGLAEVAGALEQEVSRPGLFTFDPGDGATHRIADGIKRLLALPPAERNELRAAVSAYVGREWSWDRTAERLLEAAM